LIQNPAVQLGRIKFVQKPTGYFELQQYLAVIDAIFFVFSLSENTLSHSLVIEEVFHATTHLAVFGHDASTDSTGHQAKRL
jgi:hypothetical protein